MSKRQQANALKALEEIDTKPSNTEMGDLLEIFVQIVRDNNPDLEFNTKVLTLWAQSYCVLEQRELPPAFKNVYAFGKYVKKHEDQLIDAGIIEIGEYGNRTVYSVKENSNVQVQD